MKRMTIEQIDVWTFGDGRPFEAGEDHRRLSLFPPTGLTLQGAIRSKILAESGVSFKAFKERDPVCAEVAAEIGWPDQTPDQAGWGKLRLRGPWLVSGKELYYPLPADVVTIDEAVQRLSPLKAMPFKNNVPGTLQPLWLKNTGIPKEATGWLSQTEIDKYLQQQPFSITPASELFSRESRFGVKINSQPKRPQQGHLYALDYVRLGEGVSLQVEIDGVNFKSPSGVMGLGGDARAARYRLDSMPLASPAVIDLPKQFKILFVTPAFFEAGWQPTDWNRWFPDARLVAAALKRPLSIGGRDVANNKPKALRRFVPAGSVYFFESESSTRYDQQPITDFGAEIGFGQILSGAWNYV